MAETSGISRVTCHRYGRTIVTLLIVTAFTGRIYGADQVKEDQPARVEACSQDLSQFGLCRKLSSSKMTMLDVLECVLDSKDTAADDLSDACNHEIWRYRKKLTGTKELLTLVPSTCAKELTKIESTKCSLADHASFMSCVIENKEYIRAEDCQNFVTRVEKVILGDYELVQHFVEKCESDIERHKCGRNEQTAANLKLPHTQGHTIGCLSQYVQNLTDDCAREILRVAELQVEDFHLDRALYFACRDDREFFCGAVNAGHGRVYKCLVKHMEDNKMGDSCREQIQRRQRLGWQDYKASGLVISCKSEIRRNKCRREASSNDKSIRLSQILLCLENAVHGGQELNSECKKELRQHRRTLMEDFRITPELLSACDKEYQNNCANSVDTQNSVHCLMALAQKRSRKPALSSNCRAKLEDFLKVTDVAEDWSVDPVLHQNCLSTAEKSQCASLPHNQVLDCLMNLLTDDLGDDATGMKVLDEACEATLLQIQYFVSRQFPMDSVLFDACKADAKETCGADADWSPNPDLQLPNKGPLIMSCLFRNIFHAGKTSQVSVRCAEKVRESMRRRALSVSLMPELEDACLPYLAELCVDKNKPGEELSCLQEHFEDLKGNCRVAVGNYTEVEMRNPTINPFIYKYCRDALVNDCMEDDSSETDVMDCLIEKKLNIRNKKCRAAIEHMQVVRVKHYDFTPKFKAQCLGPVMRWCKTERMTTSSLVACVSEHIRNDTINESPHRISKGCRKQVRNLIYSKLQLETGRLDPHSMYNMCRESIRNLCAGIKKGGGRIYGCLTSLSNRDIIQKEDPSCYKALLRLQQDVNTHGNVDLNLQSVCASELGTYCTQPLQEDDFTCLILNLQHEPKKFSEACKNALRVREIERNTDARLNPQLKKACDVDIESYCHDVTYGEGHILQCLKKHLAGKHGQNLTESCKDHVMFVLEEAAQVDVKIDSALYIACKEDIPSCRDVPVGDKPDQGAVEDCLKRLFMENKLKLDSCKSQVKEIIQATLVDIHVDPVLNHACAMDLIKLCADVDPGESRKINCLLEMLEDDKKRSTKRISTKCSSVLSTRAEMFQQVEIAQLDSLQDLYHHVRNSKHRNYFLIIAVSLVGCIFIFGLFCGRSTRKQSLKDK